MKPILRCWSVAILLAGALSAQFDQFGLHTMATDLTGKELIFTTTWTLKGETYNPYSKVVRYAAGQLMTLRTVPAERNPETGCLTNQPELTEPSLSLDGMRYAYTASRPGNYVCGGIPTPVGEVRGDMGDLLHSNEGTVHLSSNGLWALYVWQSSESLVNLETKYREEMPDLRWRNVKPSGRQVANDGTVVIPGEGSTVHIRRPGMGGDSFSTPVVFVAQTMADSGRFAIMKTSSDHGGPMPEMWILDLTSKEVFEAVSAEEGCTFPTLSTDGSGMVFLSASNWLGLNVGHIVQAFLMDLTTGELKQITKGVDPVREAAVTGDGRSAYVRYGDGSIQLVELESGLAHEVVPPTPSRVRPDQNPLVPGSRHTIALEGRQQPILTVAGINAPIVKSEVGDVHFILPDGLADGDYELELSYAGSPFQPFRVRVTVRDLNPRVESWNITPKIWHDSDGTAVWEASPARSGEVVEVLLSGLGPVDAEGKTLLAMNWKFSHPGQEQAGPIEVLASRKSPYEGEEGLYRVKLRVPQIHGAGSGTLSCSDARDDTVAGGAPLAVTP